MGNAQSRSLGANEYDATRGQAAKLFQLNWLFGLTTPEVTDPLNSSMENSRLLSDWEQVLDPHKAGVVPKAQFMQFVGSLIKVMSLLPGENPTADMNKDLWDQACAGAGKNAGESGIATSHVIQGLIGFSKN
eukprot:gene15330-18135_t